MNLPRRQRPSRNPHRRPLPHPSRNLQPRRRLLRRQILLQRRLHLPQRSRSLNRRAEIATPRTLISV